MKTQRPRFGAVCFFGLHSPEYGGPSMRGLVEQFRERRVWRVLIAWPSVAFVLLQAIEFFINNYDLDTRFLTAGMIVAIGLFPAGIVWNWRHGEAGRQQFSGIELSSYAVFGIATLIAATSYWRATPSTTMRVPAGGPTSTRSTSMRLSHASNACRTDC